jgi:peptide/nickel transport system ATP-binding protein
MEPKGPAVLPCQVSIEMISTVHLKKYFPVVTGIRSLFSKSKGKHVKAVDDVSFDIARGEVLGLVGESGCGKTTTGRVIVGLEQPTDGEVFVNEQSCRQLKNQNPKQFYRLVQMIFQDPYGSINPQHNASQILTRPLRYQGVNDKEQVNRKAIETLELVGLSPAAEYWGKYPHQLSGGQRQRLCIGRAIILEPQFLVADEPISMLDVSIKSGILKLLKNLIQKKNLSLLYITHDLATVGHICDSIAIMYLGRIVEIGSTTAVLDHARHPYTRALISAIPIPVPDLNRVTVNISGAVPDPINLPQGCRFSPRCPWVASECYETEPTLESQDSDGSHKAACYYPLSDDLMN